MRIAILLIPVLVLIAGAAHGQPMRSTVPFDSAGCGQAERDARESRDTIAVRRGLRRINSCNPVAYGRILADSLLKTRALTDISQLDPIWRRTQWHQDGAVFRAAMAVAADRGAGVAARIYGLRALAKLTGPDFSMPFDQMTQHRTDPRVGGRAACRFSTERDGGFSSVGAALPDGFAEEIRGLARRLFDDSSQPEEVRAAAWCTLNHY